MPSGDRKRKEGTSRLKPVRTFETKQIDGQNTMEKEAFGRALRRLQLAPGFGNWDLLGPGKLVTRLGCRPVSWSCLSCRQDKSFLAVIQESF